MQRVCALLLVFVATCVFAKYDDSVKSLPGYGDVDTTTYAGYITVNETAGANMFYFFTEATSDAKEFASKKKDSSDVDLILWMTGGPGCSSELAIFFENGPYFVQDNGTLVLNDYSWNHAAHVLYIDSPVGTGFSYTLDPEGYATDEATVGNDVYALLQGFFELHPEYADLDLYVFGESYAGHYVPAVAERIAFGGVAEGERNINLKGIAIGNGMTNPKLQYGKYAEYLYGHGLIDTNTLDVANEMYAKCLTVLSTETTTYPAFESCDGLLDYVLEAAGPINVYDVTKTCGPSNPLCYDFSAIEDYVGSYDFQQAVHASAYSNWTMCNAVVYAEIINDWFNAESPVIPMLLDMMTVTIYAGNRDFICNFLGQEAWIDEMDWNGQGEMFNTNNTLWWAPDGTTLAGYAKQARGLSRVVVSNAGHMAPADQPENMLDLVKRVLTGAAYNTPMF